ncbi:hypothetical protein SDC9_65776 [bioreactor metagenome]|uniref:JAB domain-containing protein n=1 Tax=bioreactor metagenome TaxID=1076179 RepID=A0A644XYJ3_9ZZZZ
MLSERYGHNFTTTNEETAKKIFEFFANNTNVEMSLQKLERGKEVIFDLYTSHDNGQVKGRSDLNTINFDAGWKIIEDIHNHPDDNPNPSEYESNMGKAGDKQYARDVLRTCPNAIFSVYTKSHGYTPFKPN